MVDQARIEVAEFFKDANALPSAVTVGHVNTTPDATTLKQNVPVKGTTNAVAASTPSTVAAKIKT